MRNLLTAAQAAQVLSIRPWRLYQLIQQRRLPAVRLGRSVRIDPDVLERFIADGGWSPSLDRDGAEATAP